MTAICADSVFGKKILQWNKEVHRSIQLENAKIGKKGEQLRVSYVDLVDHVSLRYNSLLQLQQQLNSISMTAKEIDAMQENIKEITGKLDKLDEFYNAVLTEQHNARMEFERNRQHNYLAQEEKKCKQQLQQETEKCNEYHNILKLKELTKRKRQSSSDQK